MSVYIGLHTHVQYYYKSPGRRHFLLTARFYNCLLKYHSDAQGGDMSLSSDVCMWGKAVFKMNGATCIKHNYYMMKPLRSIQAHGCVWTRACVHVWWMYTGACGCE